jgi:hypothetical protein
MPGAGDVVDESTTRQASHAAKIDNSLQRIPERGRSCAL